MPIEPLRYATVEQYRDAITMTDTAKDDQIEADLEAVSRYLDQRLGRIFGVDAYDEPRLFIPPDDTDTLWIDDLSADPASIKIDEDEDGDFDDETELSSSDYELLPLNAAKEIEPRPFTRIRLTPWGDHGTWPKNVRVQITGKWGWPDVPTSIERATIQITSIWRLQSPLATRRIPELGEVVEASPIAQRLVDQLTEQYRRTRYV